MALTPQQIKAIEDAKKQGLSREQALARVFVTRVQPRDTGRFAGAGGDIVQAGKGLWSDLRGRGANITESLAAGRRGEQTPFETGAQIAGNILGGAGDVGFRGIQAAVTPALKKSEEQAIASGVSRAVEATGIPQAVSEMSPRTQRNLVGGLGLFEGVTAGLGGSAARPLSTTLRDTVSRLNPFNRPTRTATPAPAATVPAAVSTAPKTTEQIGASYVNRLRAEANNPNLTPRAQQEAASAALTFREKWIGLRPDEKKRLQEMGEGKITEYLDATYLRNTSDVPTANNPLPDGVWGPQELGNYYVTKAFNELERKLNDTGSEIGMTRSKLASVKLQQPQIQLISDTFTSQVESLGLGIKNGKIIELPNRIAKTTGGDISAIQSLYDDLLKFKQSPTIENAYALRANFDAKIKFGQSARDVSNSVDPLSRSVRSAIAGESAKVIGKSNAAELKKYSDFMDAYSDLKSFTDRTAGSEYLLRLMLSGRGREARDLVETIKAQTGIDLMNDATAMKIAVERFANESQQNLFKQEVTRAGYDIAGLFQQGPVGMLGTMAQRLADYGIDAEDVIKAAAAGTGGYVLMTYTEDSGLLPAGLVVLSAMPDAARRQTITQAAKLARDMGKELKLPDNVADEVLRTLTDETPLERGLRTGQAPDSDPEELLRLNNLRKKATEGPLTDEELVEAGSILEKYKEQFPDFNQGTTP